MPTKTPREILEERYDQLCPIMPDIISHEAIIKARSEGRTGIEVEVENTRRMNAEYLRRENTLRLIETLLEEARQEMKEKCIEKLEQREKILLKTMLNKYSTI